MEVIWVFGYDFLHPPQTRYFLELGEKQVSILIVFPFEGVVSPLREEVKLPILYEGDFEESDFF